MERILVTGGAGYIGSHTVIELIGLGNVEVVSADNFTNSDTKTFDRIERITGVRVRNHAIDLCDKLAVDRVFAEEKGLSGVIHFAALKSVPESVSQPDRYYRNNIVSLLNVLEACSAHAVPRFIFSSSCSIYGNIAQLPVAEQTPMGRCESPYAYTKQVGERIVEDHAHVDKRMRTIALRYFNPVGAHASGRIGELAINAPNNLVPVITRTAMGLIKQMTVYGNDYPTRDGSCIRDYVHVSDIAAAHVMALQHAAGSDKGYDVFNLGTGEGVSVLEAVAAFEEVSGVKLNYSIGQRRDGDVGAIWSDTTKSSTVLGWKAERDLRSMMATAWKWEQELAREKHV